MAGISQPKSKIMESGVSQVMSFIEIVVLAIIQGLTEFLPISSSAHLLLPSQVLGWQDQGLAFDVAVHVGPCLPSLFIFGTT